MKTITINVSEDTYRAFQESASRSKESASELIRRAMQEYYETHLATHGSVFDEPGVDLGLVRKELDSNDDLLDEMLS